MDNPKSYWRKKYLVFFLEIAALFLCLVVLQVSGLSLALSNLAFKVTSNFYLALPVYIFLLITLYAILMLPVSFYEGYVLEHSYSLSNQSPISWAKNKIKRDLVSLVFTILLIEAFYTIARNFPKNWWLPVSIFWIIFSIFFIKIFPVVILPIFYKYSAVPNQSLKERILALAGKFGIKVLDVYQINFSKDTKKSNAAVVGWGNTRRVILADNLINEFTEDEIEVVMAHEMSHYKLNHIYKMMAFGTATTVILFFFMNKAMFDISGFFGSKDPFDLSLFPAFCLVFYLYNILITPLQNMLSRRYETDADTQALLNTSSKGSFVSMMKKLSTKNLADENPNALIEFLLYSHPSISKRLRLAERFEKT